MVVQVLDGVQFGLRAEHDLSWLHEYGRVFAVFDQQDSGNICFGVDDGTTRRFIKYAGAPTLYYDGGPGDAIYRLQQAISIYEAIQHPNLIKLLDHFALPGGYAAIFEWVDGDCLHAHWNFQHYPKYTHPQSPNVRFAALPLEAKLECLASIYSLHQRVTKAGYVAIDFYDGSVMYDFATGHTTICDIDLYKKAPYTNEMGRLWGSSRFMSPEEYVLGAQIDEVTNVFTMGALAFEFLGNNRERTLAEWHAPRALFEVASQATSANRVERYPSIAAFCAAWDEAVWFC